MLHSADGRRDEIPPVTGHARFAEWIVHFRDSPGLGQDLKLDYIAANLV
ncbi:MAG: hypothetical protein GY788_27580 [bacterium]|nr:hypothetical protein [bacterium]